LENLRCAELLRAKFRVKIKSLAAEAVMIRTEERRMSHGDYEGEAARSCLRHHRITVVRAEQRATLLARAYLLKIPYHVLEGTKSKPIDCKAIIRIVHSLSWERITEADLKKWTTPVTV